MKRPRQASLQSGKRREDRCDVIGKLVRFRLGLVESDCLDHDNPFKKVTPSREVAEGQQRDL
jgi:hypothetical protein